MRISGFIKNSMIAWHYLGLDCHSAHAQISFFKLFHFSKFNSFFNFSFPNYLIIQYSFDSGHYFRFFLKTK